MANQKPNQTKNAAAGQTARPGQTGAKSDTASTQAFLPIREVKDGVVIMKDGSLRAVLMTSAVNFALKSSSEQDAIIYAYQRFLNSLNFPVQILIQSRRLDLDFYLDKLKQQADTEAIELVKLQILEYTDFVKRLISVTNIMDKRFYVVVPFYPVGAEETAKGLSKGLSKLFSTGGSSGSGSGAAGTVTNENTFQKNKVQLMQRVEALASGLGGVGLRAATLNSEELVELFYSIYNPSTSTKERLMNVDDLTAASIGRAGAAPHPSESGAAPPEYDQVRDQKSEAPNQPAAATQSTPQATQGEHDG